MLRLFKLGLVVGILWSGRVVAQPVIISSDILHIGANTTLERDSIVWADQIRIDESVSIVNHGTVVADVWIAPGVQVTIENTGTVTGNVYLSPGASVTQWVRDPGDLTSLPVSVGLSLRVVGDRGLSLNDILVHGMDTDEIILDNATVTWDRQRGRGIMPPIDLVGEVTVHIDPASAHDGDLILGNARGDGAVFVEVPDLDDLFTATAHRTGDNIYLQIRRETDYVKILDPRRGALMNALRLYDADDKLVRAMDGAQTRDELNAIMHQSVRLHPMRLMDPVRAYRAFALADPMAAPGMDGGVSYLFGDGWNIVGARAHVGTSIGKLNVTLGGFGGTVSYADHLNDYAGALWGVSAAARYDAKYVWARAVGMGTWAAFDVGPVLGHDAVVTDPRGRAWDGVLDLGGRIRVGNVTGMPFVGVAVSRDQIAGKRHHRTTPRAGMNVSHVWDADGMAYQGSAYGTTDGRRVTVGGYLDITSIWDAAEVRFGVAGQRADGIWAYKINLNAHAAF